MALQVPLWEKNKKQHALLDSLVIPRVSPQTLAPFTDCSNLRRLQLLLVLALLVIGLQIQKITMLSCQDDEGKRDKKIQKEYRHGILTTS